ncbi:MAG TPA: hypothetical protein VD886_26560, partial [Herpetosiphonaceae bacterium]|nr:hypothetical protein [Herpetosiphonaceae bacterium]
MGNPCLARWTRLLIIGALALIAALPLPSAAVRPAVPPPALPVPPTIDPGDENWSAQFRYPGINGKVAAIVVAPNGDVYAGGTFSQADDERALGVARWDGERWHALGAGIGGGGLDGDCCFEVEALALGPDGSLYAGGRFEKAGGITVNHIARWDGSQWHSLGAGVSRPELSSDTAVEAIAVDQQGSVYATGRFTRAGGVTVNHLARWDGSQWHALAGLTGRAGALAVGPDGDLYASGQFTQASGITGRIARWDGSQWHELGAGPGTLVSISEIKFDQAGTLYAAGSFHNF